MRNRAALRQEGHVIQSLKARQRNINMALLTERDH
jgi:hypothetical protein